MITSKPNLCIVNLHTCSCRFCVSSTRNNRFMSIHLPELPVCLIACTFNNSVEMPPDKQLQACIGVCCTSINKTPYRSEGVVNYQSLIEVISMKSGLGDRKSKAFPNKHFFFPFLPPLFLYLITCGR